MLVTLFPFLWDCKYQWEGQYKDKINQMEGRHFLTLIFYTVFPDWAYFKHFGLEKYQ